jgi:hypothetical protein
MNKKEIITDTNGIAITLRGIFETIYESLSPGQKKRYARRVVLRKKINKRLDRNITPALLEG